MAEKRMMIFRRPLRLCLQRLHQAAALPAHAQRVFIFRDNPRNRVAQNDHQPDLSDVIALRKARDVLGGGHTRQVIRGSLDPQFRLRLW